jgi:hypothetical protein
LKYKRKTFKKFSNSCAVSIGSRAPRCPRARSALISRSCLYACFARARTNLSFSLSAGLDIRTPSHPQRALKHIVWLFIAHGNQLPGFPNTGGTVHALSHQWFRRFRNQSRETLGPCRGLGKAPGGVDNCHSHTCRTASTHTPRFSLQNMMLAPAEKMSDLRSLGFELWIGDPDEI